MRLITFLEAVNQDMLSGGAGILVFIPNTGRILVQIRGEHPDDKDSGKYDLFGGTLEEGETAEECARREAKEEGDLDFPEGELEEIGAFSSTENGDWDGEPYHVFLSVQNQEFPVKIDQDEVAKAGWIEPDVINDENSTNRLVKVLQHEKLESVLHNKLTEARHNNLTEKMQPVAKDVDYIFKTYYADLFRDIANGLGPQALSDFKPRSISSEELPSAAAKKAHSINPIKIRLSASNAIGNAYNAVDGDMYISPSISAMHILKGAHGSIERAVDMVPEKQKAQLRNEYNGIKIRTSLAHELSHWMNDTFHNQHIGNLLRKGQAARDTLGQHEVSKIMKKKQPDIYMTDYEIDAQIHQIRELRRRLRGRWDFITFDQMVNYDNALSSSSDRIKYMSASGKEWKLWRKMLLKRMAREGLLGKRMTGIAEAVYPYQGYNFPGDWYHGMASSSRAFVQAKGTHPSGIGIWLTNNKNIATQFAKQASRRMVDDVPVLVTAKTVAENPLVFDTYREYLDMWREYGDSQKMRRSLMRKGHDSILIAKSDTDFGGEPRMDLAVFKTSEIRVIDKEKMDPPVRE